MLIFLKFLLGIYTDCNDNNEIYLCTVGPKFYWMIVHNNSILKQLG